MSIRVKCVCGARLKAPDSCMGRSVRCSVCGNAVYVPGARSGDVSQRVNQEVQAWIRVVCNCGKVIKSPPEWAGKKGHCPRCGIEHIMPTTAPTNVVGEHEVEEVLENPEGPKPIKSMVKTTPEAKSEVKPKTNPADRPLPRPQPRSDAPDAGEGDATIEKFVDGQTLHKSGLLDLTGQEEVKILDGVAPALWDAKREQRAKAIKAGTESQVGYYRRRAFTEQLAHVRKLIDEILYRSPAATLMVIGLVLLAASLFLYRQINRTVVREGWRTKTGNAYFYDLSTNKLFVRLGSDVPPIIAPEQTRSEPMGARAYVFTCGSCSDPGALIVGYLEMYDPKTDAADQYKRFRQLMETKGPCPEAADAEDKAEAGRLVSRGVGGEWVKAASSEGKAIIAKGARECDSGAVPAPCDPPVDYRVQ